MSSLRILWAGLMGSMLTLASCRAAPTAVAAPSPAPESPHTATLPEEAPRPAQPVQGLAGHSVDGRPIAYSVHGSGPETLLLLATIHGDEDAGTPLLQRLAEELTAQPSLADGTRVVIVPALNPDGLAAGRRRNARGVDLNRNFPATNRRERASSGAAPLSEPESVALHELIERYSPQRVVSIHGWMGLVDWDGPARSLAQDVGLACGLPSQQIGSRPGSLGSFVGVDQGVPILTLEMPSSARQLGSAELWEAYGSALLTFIRWTPVGST